MDSAVLHQLLSFLPSFELFFRFPRLSGPTARVHLF
jgi:hypothetical protein